SSDATNLVTPDVNGVGDAFERDRSLAATSLVSVSSTGTPGNQKSYASSISAYGDFEVFTSDATNLVAGDTLGFSDVFVRQRSTGGVVRVSVRSDGSEA